MGNHDEKICYVIPRWCRTTDKKPWDNTLGEWSVTFNFTEETADQLNDMIAAYNAGKAESTPLQTWFEVYHPSMTNGFFVIAEPPQKLPMHEIGQNELLTIDVTFTIVEYKGMSTAVVPTQS